MKRPVLAAVFAVITLAASAEAADACKLANDWLGIPSMPPYAATVGAQPLVLMNITSLVGQLVDAAGNTIEVATDPTFAAVDAPGITFQAVRPVAPLAAGSYYWAWDRERPAFFVDPALDDTPEPYTNATFRIVIDRPDGEFGCNDDSCHDIDFTRLELSFVSDARARFLLELEDRRSSERLTLFGSTDPDPDAHHEVTLFDWGTDLALGDRAICVALTPVSDSGTLGERIDLGCSNPDSGKHIVDKDGCTSARTGDAYAILMALGVLALQRRRALPRLDPGAPS